tara:strand:+ start:215 stop:637 length:423 start_codon:yes stop_codon:yes gene_type:complete
MQLNKIKTKSDETVVVLLKLEGEALLNDAPKGKEATPMSITLNHPHSAATRDVEFAITDDMIAEMKADESTLSREMKAQEMFERRLDRVARNVIVWDITLDENGTPELSLDNVKTFFDDFPMFLYQAEEALDKEKVFILS